MMKKNMSVLSLALLVSAGAYAKDLSIKVVSAQDIMAGTDLAQEASKTVESKRMEYMKQAQSRAQEIEKKEKDLSAKAATMSTDAQRKEAKIIADLRQDLESDQKKWMQELQLDAQSEMERLGQQFDAAVQKVAQEKKADLVFERESGRIVFAAPELMMTDDIKTAMNAEYKTQLASAKKNKVTA